MNNEYKISPLSCIVFFMSLMYLVAVSFTWNAEISTSLHFDRTFFFLLVFLYIVDVVSKYSDRKSLHNYFDSVFAGVLILSYISYKFSLITMTFMSFRLVITFLIMGRSFMKVAEINEDSHDERQKRRKFVTNAMNNPARTVLLGYLYLILVGTLLLSLPISVTTDEPISFSNALFMAASAGTITGLATVDLLTTFSVFGKTVLCILVQVGGLGVMIVSYFFGYIIFRRRMKYQNKANISADTNNGGDEISLSRTILRIIIFTVSAEFVGSVLLFVRFLPEYGFTLKNIGYAVFHSITAFCNAGFFLYSDSMMPFVSDVPLNLIFAALIIVGGLGFPIFNDIAGYIVRWYKKNIRRQFVPYKGLSVNTKIVLIVYGILLVVGVLLIYGFEHGNTIRDLDIGTQYLASFFQSVTVRTAGFNTLDLAALRLPTLFTLIVLMFIGGASGSMAGGVKVNTLGILIVSLFSFLHGRSENVVMHKSISHSLVVKSFFILFMSQIVLIISIIILSCTHTADLVSICFEAVSAFSTTGATIGLTSTLNVVGKYLLIVLMILGKIGPMTLLMLLSREETPSNIRYPDVDILIG
ncbi:MAG: hypothetical protein IKQ61_05335 [Spirochaetales bacterium]|nr:hypothetical protein [Spirochaetales bacterium]